MGFFGEHGIMAGHSRGMDAGMLLSSPSSTSITGSYGKACVTQGLPYSNRARTNANHFNAMFTGQRALISKVQYFDYACRQALPLLSARPGIPAETAIQILKLCRNRPPDGACKRHNSHDKIA